MRVPASESAVRRRGETDNFIVERAATEVMELRLEATNGSIDVDIGTTRLLLVPLLAVDGDGEIDDAVTKKGRVVVEIVIVAEKKKIIFEICSPYLRQATMGLNKV